MNGESKKKYLEKKRWAVLVGNCKNNFFLFFWPKCQFLTTWDQEIKKSGFVSQILRQFWWQSQIFLFLDLTWSKIAILVKNKKNVIFAISDKNRPFFLFQIIFLGLSIQFRYNRIKNLRSLMPLFMKYPAGKCVQNHFKKITLVQKITYILY